MDAEAAVLPAALQADPDAVGHGNPLRVVGAAFETPLKGGQGTKYTHGIIGNKTKPNSLADISNHLGQID